MNKDLSAILTAIIAILIFILGGTMALIMAHYVDKYSFLEKFYTIGWVSLYALALILILNVLAYLLD